MYLLNGIPAFLGVGFIHLAILNLLVIFVEILLLRKFSKITDVGKGGIVMANLISAIAGLVIASNLTFEMGGNFWDGYIIDPVERKAFIAGLAIFIGFTIVVESPFYYWSMRRQKNFLSALYYAAIINLMTNIPITLFYYFQKLNYVDD